MSDGGRNAKKWIIRPDGKEKVTGELRYLTAYQDSPASIQAAAERKVWGIGNDSDMGRFAPDTYISKGAAATRFANGAAFEV